MLENLFTPNQPQVVEINTDPRPGVNSPSAKDIQQWLDQDVEIIDLGSPRRDQVIQPTTWHV